MKRADSHPGRRPALGPAPASRRTPPRGVASLVVVLLLFFLTALVAVYTSRNMIFEQRTSANQYRSTQAFEAAEAGLNWALAQLNGGRIDASCRPSASASDVSFRARYIETIDARGDITLKTLPGSTDPPLAACVFDPDPAVNDWRCDCPGTTAPTLPTVASAGAKPMFRIRFEYLPAPSTRRDVIRIVSAGCTRADAACLAQNPTAPAGDAMAVLTHVVTLRSGMSTVPTAALTARGNVDGGTGALQLINTDPASNGMTIHAGGTPSGNLQLTSLPGTPPEESTGTGDSRLAGFASGQRMFSSRFGMSAAMHQAQPGAVRLDCSAGCNAAQVNGAARDNPGKAIWLDGNLDVDGDIGAAPTGGSLAASELAASRPLLLLVTGTTTLTSGTVHGMIYGRAANWDRGAGTTEVRGALVAEGNFGGSGSQRIVYDPALLAELRTRSGTFVRVPGGWKDF